MRTSIRDLKAHLSEYVRKAAEGEDVQVSIHGRVVARIVPPARVPDVAALATQAGITWAGGKPTGLPDPEDLRGGTSLADWVLEDRR